MSNNDSKKASSKALSASPEKSAAPLKSTLGSKFVSSKFGKKTISKALEVLGKISGPPTEEKREKGMKVLAALGRLTAIESAREAQKHQGDVLPFPRVGSASITGKKLQTSMHQRRSKAKPLAKDAPNVLIILLDDAGFAQADTVGGPIHTPTLTRIADTGVKYNAFHTTAISSATRASLLTGRNHHAVGNGMVSELGTDWDGYTGTIPNTSATIAEVLQQYGYATAAFGKWHNTDPNDVNAMGPFDRWPTGMGFNHFYGFMGGESSQWEPNLYCGTTPVELPHDPTYHLTEDLAAKAVDWLRQRQAATPDRPFFMYWAPGAVHAPHHVFKEWSDKYKGQFDEGWDVYRDKVFKRQKELGFIPADAKLNPRHATLPAWDSLSEKEKAFQARLMEVYAGFLEHTDTQAGKLVDELERQGIRDNTLIFYVFSDNGASAEGLGGSINEMVTLNGMNVPAAKHMEVLEQMGGLDILGGPMVDNIYHAAWAQAGMTPFQGTKLVAGYFGGTRVPLAISWPKNIKADTKVRPQFHHVNDIAPTIYDAIGIRPPKTFNGFKQDKIDGISMAYTFNQADAAPRKKTQYFEVLGSRGVYHEGWMGSVFGPRLPWQPDPSVFKEWNASKDKWALYNINADYSQSTDLSEQNKSKTREMEKRFDAEAIANKVYPLGAGLWPFVKPEDRTQSPYKEFHYTTDTHRVPEFAAPNLRSVNSHATVDVDLPANAEGVLYSLGGVGGGVSLYIDQGVLTYEYNGLLLTRTKASTSQPLPVGRCKIEVTTTILEQGPGAPAKFTVAVNGVELASATTPYTAPLGFSASEALHVGADKGSPVSPVYAQRSPFAFNGTIHNIDFKYV